MNSKTKPAGALKMLWAILNSDKRTIAPFIDGSITLLGTTFPSAKEFAPGIGRPRGPVA